MLWLKRVLLILVFLLVALATMDFMLENQQSISLQFLEMQSPLCCSFVHPRQCAGHFRWLADHHASAFEADGAKQ